MEKNLQMSKYLKRDLKGYVTKSRNKDFVSERFHVSRPNTRNPNGSWNGFQRNINNNKSQLCLPESVSLSNEDYIIANAQLWVNQNSKSSNDIHSNWEYITQINFFVNEELNCPICMEPPIIPRTDKCGHVYCLPCLNKFLSFKSEFNNKCALCNQFISPKRIKRAGIITRAQIKNGEMLSMILMKKNKNELFPSPIESSVSSFPVINTLESRFSNVAICPDNDLLSIIQIEILTLEDELKVAIKDENDRIKSISDALVSVKNEYEILFASSKNLSCPIVTNPGVADSIDVSNESVGSVYYQSEDGSNVFMCPVNWKCMSHEFLNMGRSLPVRIMAPIIDIDRFIVTREFVNRYRYLRYLPVGSSVSFVELDLDQIVTQATLDHFHEAIEARSDSRRHRQKLDDILTSRKISHENSFNRVAGVTYLSSAMPTVADLDPGSFQDSDFMALPSIMPRVASVDPNTKTDFAGKKSFADMIQARRPTLEDRAARLTLADPGATATEGPTSSGISLSDCVVAATKKRPKRR